MADKFHVGQRVRVKWSAVPDVIGKVVHITKQREWHNVVTSYRPVFAYTTDYVGPLGRLCPREESLEPVDDGWQTTTWDQCMWRPKAREVV